MILESIKSLRPPDFRRSSDVIAKKMTNDPVVVLMIESVKRYTEWSEKKTNPDEVMLTFEHEERLLAQIESGLDKLSSYCCIRAHGGYHKLRSDCSHPDCQVRSVLET